VKNCDRNPITRNVDHCRRSLTGSDPATGDLSQRRRAKYGNNNDNNKDFITTRFDDKDEVRPEAVSRSSLIVTYVFYRPIRSKMIHSVLEK